MSSPITGSSFTVATLGESFCNRITNLLALSSKMKLWFDWAFDSAGNATTDFKSMFLLPTGSIIPYYVSGSESSVKTSVEALNKPAGDTGLPFWRLCDGTNGTPDLRGRTLLGAGKGTGLTERTFASVGGAESATISGNQIPAHGHVIEGRLRFAENKNVDGEDDFGAVANRDGSGSPYSVAEYSSNSADYNYLYAKPQSSSPDSLKIDTMTPYYAVWYIIRTSRTE
jgi:microcystin-dependent protein